MFISKFGNYLIKVKIPILHKLSSSVKFKYCFALLITFFSFSLSSNAQVTASFTADTTKGCAPLIVNFSDHSTGNPTSWSWDFGNGQHSTLHNPGTYYVSSGVYSVTLTVSNGSVSNTKVLTNYITVYANPTAGFSENPSTTCVGQSVKFTNATTIAPGGAAISNWAWDFGDGNLQTVTTTTTSHSYSSPGSYPVSLLVTDLNGCTSTKTETVVVLAPPTPSFTASPLASCSAPLAVTFTNTSVSVGATTYSWSFGNGGSSTQKNPTTTYTANGSYNVTLIVTQSGCKDSIVKPNYITIQNMNASFVATPSLVCTGQPITFSNTSVPAAATSTWTLGDGGTSNNTSPVYTYSAAGTYTVKLSAIAAQGCSGSTSQVIKVSQTPVAAFTADTMIACSVPFAVTFSNASTGATNYSWHFGDGNTSVQANPTNIYTTPGTYTVSLTAINNVGSCSDSIVKNGLIVIIPPVGGFTPLLDSGCVPLPVSFASTSTSNPLFPITSYTWSYGDGGTNITGVPSSSYTYNTQGVFSPTLTIETKGGCINSQVCNNCIRAGNIPVSSYTFSPDSVCYGLPVTFTNTSTGATGWQWLFGPGGTSLLKNPMYIFPDTGYYPIRLVSYFNGCTDTTTVDSVLILAPKAQFTYTLSCTNYFTVAFTNTSEGADSLVWDFGDGTINSANVTSVTHTYSATGPITCNLTAFNHKANCSNSFPLSFVIAKPVAAFTVSDSNGCYPFTPVFTNISQDAAHNLWNFGIVGSTTDTSTKVNPSYTYNTPGSDSVKLIVTDVNGCKDSISKRLVTYGPIPYFSATPLSGCSNPGFLVTFKDSTQSDSAIVNWQWNFGNGSTSNIEFPSTTYSVTGLYSVTLTVTDKNGCKDSLTKNNYIRATFPVPNASVTPLPFSCVGNVLTFNASTTNAFGPQYSWNFGDGTSTTSPSYNPITTHSYAADGLYTYTLTVTDTNGISCASYYKDTVLILKTVASFTFNVAAKCGDASVTFTNTSTGYPNQWNWNFGDGGTSTQNNTSHQYLSPGSYTVSLTVTNAGGCTSTYTSDSIIIVPGPIGTFTYAPITGCIPLTVTFVASSKNSLTYDWDLGNGTLLQNAGDSIVYTYNQAGVYPPLCLLNNTVGGQNCPNQATNLTGPSVNAINGVNVTLTPHNLTLGDDTSANIISSVSGGHPNYTYSWSPANNEISCFNCPDITVTGNGENITYTLAVKDKNGCEGFATLVIISEPCVDHRKIPNIFTPNGDKLNDVFYIPGTCPEESYSLSIYDRWGILLFYSVERNHVWDGRENNGDIAPDGTYYFIVNVGGSTYKGFVELIR